MTKIVLLGATSDDEFFVWTSSVARWVVSACSALWPLPSGLPDLSTAKVRKCFVFRSSCFLYLPSYANVPIELQNHRAWVEGQMGPRICMRLSNDSVICLPLTHDVLRAWACPPSGYGCGKKTIGVCSMIISTGRRRHGIVNKNTKSTARIPLVPFNVVFPIVVAVVISWSHQLIYIFARPSALASSNQQRQESFDLIS